MEQSSATLETISSNYANTSAHAHAAIEASVCTISTYTLDGMLECPQPRSMPNFRWSYTNVDSRGVYIQVVLHDISAASAVQQVREHFPSFDPTTVREGVTPAIPDLIWQGTFAAPPKKSWLRRLFSRSTRTI